MVFLPQSILAYALSRKSMKKESFSGYGEIIIATNIMEPGRNICKTDTRDVCPEHHFLQGFDCFCDFFRFYRDLRKLEDN